VPQVMMIKRARFACAFGTLCAIVGVVAASAAQQASSRILVAQSQVSDIYSLLSDVNSDLASRVRTAVADTVVETAGSITLKQAIDIILAAVAGRTDTGGVVFRSPDGTAIRISATVDASNNRTAITLTPSA